MPPTEKCPKHSTRRTSETRRKLRLALTRKNEVLEENQKLTSENQRLRELLKESTRRWRCFGDETRWTDADINVALAARPDNEKGDAS